MARAWYEVVVNPARFFRTGVAPGDQAPGLLFVMAVVLVEEVSRILVAPSTYPDLAPGVYEFVRARPLFAVLWVGLVVFLVTPAVLHLLGAVVTVVLIPLVEERAGVSETVQVLAYATAPCVFAAVPVLLVQVAAVAYGAILLVVGIGVVHGTSVYRASVAAAVPVLVVYVYGFRGIEVVGTLLRQWYII
jgi:hypothetical protein